MRWTLARIIKVAIPDSDVGMDMEGLMEDLPMPDRQRSVRKSGAKQIRSAANDTLMTRHWHYSYNTIV